MIKELLWEHRYLIIMAIAAAAYIVYLITNNKFKETVLGLMLQAERMCKAKMLESGQAQEDWVYIQLLSFFPKYVNLFGEVKTRAFIKYLFKSAKDLLDDGKLNNSTTK